MEKTKKAALIKKSAPAKKTTVSQSTKKTTTIKKAATKTPAVAKTPAPKKTAAKRGAKTKYKQEYAEQARKLCLLGYIDVQLAEFFNVVESTIHKWKKDHPEFSESIKKGKDIADAEVAETLFKKATGFTEEVEKIVVVDGVAQVEKYKQYFPPEVVAQIFWLKNRQPANWKDKAESQVTHNYSVETLDQLADIGEKNRQLSLQMMEKVRERQADTSE